MQPSGRQRSGHQNIPGATSSRETIHAIHNSQRIVLGLAVDRNRTNENRERQHFKLPRASLS